MFNSKKTTTKPTKKPVQYKPALKDTKSKSNQGIILMNDEDIQAILSKSGEHAKTNEYQVHYWSLVLRHKAADDSILDICIPTVYFNYKQTVSMAHIHFDLSDVDDMSDAVLPIHNMKVKEILDSGIITKLEANFGITLEPLGVNISSLHCHP